MRTGLCVLVLMSAVACGGAPTAPSSPAPAAPATSAPSLSAVAIAGTAPIVGGTAQFSAAATLSDGTSQAAWSSSNPAIASVSISGLVTGVGAGDADITAARMDFALTGSTPTLTGLRTVPPANAWRLQGGGDQSPIP